MKTMITAVAFATTLVTMGSAGPALADDDLGRQLTGTFCSNPQALPKPGACMQLSFGASTVQGYTGSTNRTMTLRPGTYWLNVNDTSPHHNFSLEAPDGTDQDITGVEATPGWVTIQVDLKPGSWTLFCDADDHRADGMYLNIQVGGAGQVGR